jgi:hypothetical protein
VTLRISVPPARQVIEFPRDADEPVVLGRARVADVRVGDERVQGRWTVSKVHAEVRWDGIRWTTTNVSGKPGLLHVYEPGYEELPLEPGRAWTPVRHRWSYSFGRAGHRFHVVCATDDHEALLATAVARAARGVSDDDADGDGDDDDDATAGIEALVRLAFTDLELATLHAYYGAFAELPRPSALEPAGHDAAALRLDRSRDSLRKALERINDKISRVQGSPPMATGRNVSPEIGRWLARVGVLDP